MMKLLKDIQEGQKKFGEDIAMVVNTLMLSVVYFFGVGLTSIAAKLFKKRFLNLKKDDNAITYWKDINLSKKNMEEYYRQF